MKRFFARNIGATGRIIRAVFGIALIVAAVMFWDSQRWLVFVLGAAGLFVLFEALRGWCLMRACGIKTKF